MDFLGISYLHLSPFRYFTSVAILENCYNFLDELNYMKFYPMAKIEGYQNMTMN
jgi:hypothetical protein